MIFKHIFYSTERNIITKPSILPSMLLIGVTLPLTVIVVSSLAVSEAMLNEYSPFKEISSPRGNLNPIGLKISRTSCPNASSS